MTGKELKAKLKSGEAVIGTMVSELRTPQVGQIMANAGFDFMYIDMEHSPLNMETVADMILGAKYAGIPTIVRTPGIDRCALARPLDSGADGVLCPQTETREQVENIVAWTKYYPLGQRGMALSRAHSRYRSVKAQEYCPEANDSTVVVIQIESKNAIATLDQLVSVEGVDAAFIGPADLSQTYGLPGQANDPQIVEDLHKFIKICQDHDVVPGIHVYNPTDLRRWYDAGMRLFAMRNDISMLSGAAAQAVAESRAALE
ncbi:MAG: HpcH/HpaI aldolase family protein [Limnochordia bacterium]